MAGRVHCPNCEKGYTWKPELAGRKVKCRCGGVFRVAESDPAKGAAEAGPAAEQAPEGDIFEMEEAPTTNAGGALPAFDLAEAPPLPAAAAARKEKRTCSSCGAVIADRAVICVNCGMNLSTGRKVRVSDGLSTSERASKNKQDYMRTQYMYPGIALVVGAIMLVGAAYLQFVSAGDGVAMQGVTLGATVFGVMMLTAVETVAMLIGCLIAAKLIGVGFGSLGSAMVKLPACFVVPAAIDLIVSSLTGFGLFGWGAGIFTYYIMLRLLFDLEEQETVLVIAIVWLTKLVIGFAIGSMLSSMLGG